jgi:hypothetical protein
VVRFAGDGSYSLSAASISRPIVTSPGRGFSQR